MQRASEPVDGLKIVLVGDTRDSRNDVVTSVPVNLVPLKLVQGVEGDVRNPESIWQLPRPLHIL